MKFIVLIFSLVLFAAPATAKIRVPAKATASCQSCVKLKLQADVIEKELFADENDANNILQAILKTKQALVDFLKTSGSLDEKEIDAILRIWSVVAIHDVYVSIPTEPEIKDKISDEDFRKIQTTASGLALRYCQPSESKEPAPPCSHADDRLKRSYQSIAMAIVQAFAERESPPQDSRGN